MGKVEDLTPYTIVALQECERMNNLMGEIRRSLREVELGLKVRENERYANYSFNEFGLLCNLWNYERESISFQ